MTRLQQEYRNFVKIWRKKGKSMKWIAREWKAKKGGKRSKSRNTAKRKIRRVKNMPRKKGKKKSYYKRYKDNPLAILIASTGYGMIRQPISAAIQPIVAQVPILNIGDEAAMFLLATFAKKKFKQKIVKDVCTAAQYIEGARLGATLMSGVNLFGGGSSGGSGKVF
jgi:hypothetical protein